VERRQWEREREKKEQRLRVAPSDAQEEVWGREEREAGRREERDQRERRERRERR
jgi:hypothetical protein